MQLPKIGLMLLMVGAGLTAAAQDGAYRSSAETTELGARELLQGSRDAVEEISDRREDSEKLLADVEKSNRPDQAETEDCVRTRVNGIVALEGVSQIAYKDLQTALAADQLGHANHQYRRIGIALGKVRQFAGEAQACVGDGASADGITQVSGGDQGGGDGDETNGSGTSDGTVGVDPPGTTPFE